MAVETETPSLPIIDLAPFHGGSAEAVAGTGRQVFDAFKNIGFAYIKNHGLPQELIDEAFDWVGTRAFSSGRAVTPHISRADL
jgi:isopenicillin N synthase-like dioxygenase